MLYPVNFNVHLISKLTLFLLLTTISCNKNKVEIEQKKQYSISPGWEINTEDQLWDADGQIYKNEYVVFSANDTKRTIQSYDLTNKNLLWEYDLTGTPGLDQKIDIHDQYLVLYNQYTGVTLFDLDKKELINTIRFEAPSYTPPTFYNGKVYAAVQDHYHTKYTIKTINVADGAINDIYEWSSSENLFSRLSSPLISEDENKNINFILILHLFNREDGDDYYGEKFLMSVNKEGSLNWIDTLGSLTDGGGFIKRLPVLINENVIIHNKGDLISYDTHTGNQNWVKAVSHIYILDLILKNNNLYTRFGSERYYSKLNIHTGEKIWQLGQYLRGSNFNDFELFDNHMVVVSNNFGRLLMFDDHTGKSVQVENQFEQGIANPKFYVEDSLFITHHRNKVIGFKLKPVN